MLAYVWERRTDRYRDMRNGRFVPRRVIYAMLSRHQLSLSETYRDSSGHSMMLVYSRRDR